MKEILIRLIWSLVNGVALFFLNAGTFAYIYKLDNPSILAWTFAVFTFATIYDEFEKNFQKPLDKPNKK